MYGLLHGGDARRSAGRAWRIEEVSGREEVKRCEEKL